MSDDSAHVRAEPDAIERPEDDDYDLLTYGEAGARLTEEIRRQNRVLADLESSATDSADSRAQIAAVRNRIGDLKAAAKRQQEAAAEPADFTKFFGYDPRTK
jgi:hypothetical protein